jgi:aminoglycoside phosphotransferase
MCNQKHSEDILHLTHGMPSAQPAAAAAGTNQPENQMDKINALAEMAENMLGITIVVTASGRAAHYASETSRGYWLTRGDLAYAKACADEHGDDAYSHWCAATGKPMSRRSERRIFT